MAILSGVLSLGNIDFAAQSSNEDKVQISRNEDLQVTADLFGIDQQELRECMTRLTNKTRGEHIQIDFNKHQAEGECSQCCGCELSNQTMLLLLDWCHS